jgi:hypothetical protein
MSPILEDFNDVSAGCIKKKVTPLIKANRQTSILIHSKKGNTVLTQKGTILTITSFGSFSPLNSFQFSPREPTAFWSGVER